MKIEHISKHAQEITEKLLNLQYKEKYKFLFPSGYLSEIESETGTWCKNGFAIIDNGIVVGYVTIGITRPTNCVNINNMVLFTNKIKHKIFMNKEITKYIEMILSEKYFTKIAFCMIVGNPVEKIFDKIINKYNGKIVGVLEKDSLTRDGIYRDLKMYEIVNKNFNF